MGPVPYFSKPVPWKALRVNAPGETFLCSRVLAMGSSSAVALLQHVHRRSGISRGLAPSLELISDKKLPMRFKDKQAEWTQFFLDDTDSQVLVSGENLANSLGKSSKLQLQQRRSAEAVGLTYSKEKAIEGEAVVERKGALVDGLVGRVSVPDKTFLSTYVFAFRVLGLWWIHWQTWLMLLGRINRILEFRSPLSSCLNSVWHFVGLNGGRHPTLEVHCELLACLCGLQSAATDMRSPIWEEVICSDASTEGGGACVSTGLSKQ